MMQINLGSGKLYRYGWINCDISKKVKADKYFDAREGLPFKNDFADEIHCGCILEQICSNEDFLNVMNEIWRVLKPEGKLTGYAPNANHSCAFQDPMDCRFFTENTFNYFEKGHDYYEGFGKNYGFKPWKDIWYSTNDSGIIHFELKPSKNE